MRLIDERTGLDYIPRDECMRLLATQHLGRIGVVVAGRPVVLPINYVMDDSSIVFRTDDGTKFDAAVRGEFVAFEIDEVALEYHTGWSILVTGVAEEIVDPDEQRRAERLPLRAWAPGAKSHYLRVTPVTISGRRIVSPEPSPDDEVIDL